MRWTHAVLLVIASHVSIACGGEPQVDEADQSAASTKNTADAGAEEILVTYLRDTSVEWEPERQRIVRSLAALRKDVTSWPAVFHRAIERVRTPRRTFDFGKRNPGVWGAIDDQGFNEARLRGLDLYAFSAPEAWGVYASEKLDQGSYDATDLALMNWFVQCQTRHRSTLRAEQRSEQEYEVSRAITRTFSKGFGLAIDSRTDLVTPTVPRIRVAFEKDAVTDSSDDYLWSSERYLAFNAALDDVASIDRSLTVMDAYLETNTLFLGSESRETYLHNFIAAFRVVSQADNADYRKGDRRATLKRVLETSFHLAPAAEVFSDGGELKTIAATALARLDD